MTREPKTPFRTGFVALIGRPNVGKSTLLNRLIGERLAITSHKPQTTRHRILGITTSDQAQLICVDTPGLHLRGDQPLNRHLNRTAHSALADVDLLLFVVEALRWGEEDARVLEIVQQSGLPTILVVNKVDLVHPREALFPYLQAHASDHNFIAVVPISARKNGQLGGLEQQMIAQLPEREAIFPEDQLSDRSERFFAAELVREQLTRRYAKEIPYALTVEIERFEEEGELYRIHALVWVEKPGQKAILIGKGGEAMREAATHARLEMERFFGRKVFLQVWVKVKKSWSSDEQALARLGYSE